MEGTWRARIKAAASRLAEAGVPSPLPDAELLAAHVAGTSRGGLFLAPGPDAAAAAAYEGLVAERVRRVPLQYLTGAGFAGTDLAVGPGVFVPRPETELLVEWALDRLGRAGPATVVDLCSGSGAVALAVARHRPAAEVYAVETDAEALPWLRRNAEGTAVRVVAGDATDPAVLSELDGRCDAVLSNPPYVPDGTAVPPEVRRDPPRAVFGGADGLDVIRPLLATARRLLRPGGVFAVEHDDTQGTVVPALLRAAGWTEVAGHRDLAGRARFATAVKEDAR